jgi:hypothetical protein
LVKILPFAPVASYLAGHCDIRGGHHAGYFKEVAKQVTGHNTQAAGVP